MTIESRPCPCCGQSRARAVGLEPGSALLICGRCGLGRRWPPAASAHLRAHYEDRYLGDEAAAERIAQDRLPLYEPWLEFLERATQGRRLVDVGCGRGHFLEVAARRGWDALGLELFIGSAAAGAARGVRILEGGDERLEELQARFDVVTMWNVLDQMPRPEAALPRAFDSLVSGGRLLLRVPNIAFHLALLRAWSLLRLRRRCPAVFHGWAFSARSLQLLMERAGFTHVRIMRSQTTRGGLRAVLNVVSRALPAHLAPSLVALATRP